MKPIQVIIAGAGGRGYGYAQYAKMHPERMQVVGVAEPRDFHRERIADEFSIPDAKVFLDWREMADAAKFADAIIIATQDAMHEAPAVAFAELGYGMLLEKPLAPTLEACEHIIEAVKQADIPFAVGHVMRYTQFTRLVKQLLAEGAIGDLVSVDLVEPVGFWHMAHSFVRGNWRNSQESSFMLLAKSCHDLDWIHYIMEAKCEQLSSFGTLSHFKPDQAPRGAAKRCLDCPIEVEQRCPYSAKRIYLDGFVQRGYTGWLVNIITEDLTTEGVTEALREGPYGRCVYYCDNDVVDHQVVNMAFDGGQTATFSMMAFTPMEHRSSRLFGTRGQIVGNGETVELYDFLSDTRKTIEPESGGNLGIEGHGGGDYGLMNAFTEALLTGDRNHILSGPEETLASHALVFAAEQSRLENRIIRV